jgi:phasin family protein
MSNTFDPNAIYEAYRTSLAPAVHAQEEALKAAERFGRYQHAMAGDYLEWSLAQAKLSFSAKTPAELAAKQAELATQVGEKLRGRVQELVNLATEAQTSFNGLLAEAAAKVKEVTQKAA